MRPLSSSQRKSLERATARYEISRELALLYLRARGINPDTAERFRLGVVSDPLMGHEQFAGRLSIPSIGPRGVYSLRFRCIEEHDCKERNCPKYLGFGDAQTRLFNIQDIHDAVDEICVTEGELDCVVLSQCGFYAVGVPGSDNWKKHHPRMLTGFERVFVLGDGDKAGAGFAKRVVASLSNAVNVQLPQGMDVNDYYLAKGEDGIRELIHA